MEVINISAGGVNDAEGARIFLLEEDNKFVKNAYDLIKEIKGEPLYKPVSFVPLKNLGS